MSTVLEGRELIFLAAFIRLIFTVTFQVEEKCAVFSNMFSEPGFLAASYGVSTLCNVSCKFCSGQREASKCFK